jgi:mono/diheme cytochrome c family protein
MNRRFFLVFCILLSCQWLSTAQSIPDYDSAYIGKPMADPIMQHNKETFVLYGCAYCHGMYLKPVGEATDLRKSVIVATDVDANLIGPILRTGIPQTPKSSPMPQFSDLSDQEIRAIAAYIHYCRADENYKALMNEPVGRGNVAAGQAFYQKSCASCHSVDQGFATIGDKYDANGLRDQVLSPTRFRTPVSSRLSDVNDIKMRQGRDKHQRLLENFNKADVDNIVAYLRTLK